MTNTWLMSFIFLPVRCSDDPVQTLKERVKHHSSISSSLSLYWFNVAQCLDSNVDVFINLLFFVQVLITLIAALKYTWDGRCKFAISNGSPAFQKIKAVELLKVHLESSDQIITLSLPDPPLVSTSAPIKSLDHGSTLGIDNKQTALFFLFF